MPAGFTVWFTGLSGAGKTTLATLLADELKKAGTERVEVLDGDMLRGTLNRGLGYSRQDREENIRRITFLSQVLTRNGVATIVAAISPYRAGRDEARRTIGAFVEVYVKCPLDVLVNRDVKGLYRRALAGTITNFTGISDSYEEPLSPDVVVETDTQSPRECLDLITQALLKKGLLPES